ncbi:MAG: FprA family A-type flavoprotein [Myxococcales bacterium]|nr:FprA family A-type flavoprotein [Myxococcales bacterium]
MSESVLYDRDGHRNILLEDYGHGLAVQANQHLVIHGDEGMILDPGGHKVYTQALGATGKLLGKSTLRHIFLSHQDPDIVAAVNGWLMTTDADAWCSELWVRFVPHFGVDRLVADRLKPIADEGMYLPLGDAEMVVLPAHFLHSCGNFHLYDPVSKILYTGDLGASLGVSYVEVPDFDAHLPFMEGFHRRYMASNRALRAWADMVRELDVAMIAPQHGALFRGEAMVQRFLDWISHLECGVDVMGHSYRVPPRRG